ncbi:uncharacterized protein CMC5_029420 [Chondromyces crocatus]|uniref:Uncharacterized protein n=1 Tax=Chondromyces crocatus TaxID=52 RepID=A0A0K1ED41_CHOCO|nr:uncharacterized protein CMC5_029420 [Chondromyces crocatus]
MMGGGNSCVAQQLTLQTGVSFTCKRLWTWTRLSLCWRTFRADGLPFAPASMVSGRGNAVEILPRKITRTVSDRSPTDPMATCSRSPASAPTSTTPRNPTSSSELAVLSTATTPSATRRREGTGRHRGRDRYTSPISPLQLRATMGHQVNFYVTPADVTQLHLRISEIEPMRILHDRSATAEPREVRSLNLVEETQPLLFYFLVRERDLAKSSPSTFLHRGARRWTTYDPQSSSSTAATSTAKSFGAAGGVRNSWPRSRPWTVATPSPGASWMASASQ